MKMRLCDFRIFGVLLLQGANATANDLRILPVYALDGIESGAQQARCSRAGKSFALEFGHAPIAENDYGHLAIHLLLLLAGCFVGIELKTARSNLVYCTAKPRHPTVDDKVVCWVGRQLFEVAYIL